MISGVSLAIEITRKCNMCCVHCLRGDAENKTISRKVIAQCSQVFSDIDILTITGGEPSLSPTKIRECAEFLDYNSWYVVSNGKFRFPDEYVDCIYTTDYVKARYGNFLHSIWKLNNNAKDNGLSCLAFSGDKFHDDNGKNGRNKVFCLQEFSEEFDINITDHSKHYNNNSILGEGRGVNYSDEIDKNDLIMKLNSDAEYDQENDYFQSLNVYVNVYGKCFLACDFSYETQRKKEWCIGSIFEPEKLKSNLINFCNKLKKERKNESE